MGLRFSRLQKHQIQASVCARAGHGLPLSVDTIIIDIVNLTGQRTCGVTVLPLEISIGLNCPITSRGYLTVYP